MTGALGVSEIPAPKVRVEPGSLAPGSRGQLTVTLDIPDGCHIQSHAPREPFLIPTAVEFDTTDGLVVGPVVYPEPGIDRFDWTPVELDVHRGPVEIAAPIDVGPTAAGRLTITGLVRYQPCTATSCLPPVEHPIEADLEVQAEPVPDQSDRAERSPSTTARLESPQTRPHHPTVA